MQRHHATRAAARKTDPSATIDQLRASLTTASTDLGLVSLTPLERKKAPRMHDGAEPYVKQMSALATEQPSLCPNGVDAADLLAKLDAVEHLSLLRAVVVGLLRAIDDSILVDEGSAYRGALDILAVARGQARRDASLEARIAPFEAFLATGPHIGEARARRRGCAE